MSNYADLEISLSSFSDDVYSVEMHYSDRDDPVKRPRKRGRARFDFEGLHKNLLSPTGYGELLKEILFADPELLSFFKQVRGVAQTAGKTLRLRLSIDKTAGDLHRLRWETLRDPQDGSWMLTKEGLLFSRFLSSEGWEPVQLRPRADLRALVVIANPRELKEGRVRVDGQALQPIQVEDELERARAGLGNLVQVVLASEAEKPGQVTLQNLFACLRAGEGFDILYLVCHGALLTNRTPPGPYLWLEKEDGTAAVQPGSDLVDYLRDLPPEKKPRLAVLASCQSGGRGSDVHGALSALGPSLAEAGIPAVVAMQGNISMATAADFMQRFFEELTVDGQIDRALAVARGEVRQRPDSWMPVLYMRLERGMLWETPRELEKKPFMAPRGVENLVGRLHDLEALKQRLLKSPGGAVTVLMQFPGIGKTELAVFLAHDEDIQKHYSGVLWAALGKKPNMNALLSEWAQELGVPPEEMNRADSTGRFKIIRRYIGQRRMLLVVDDAWTTEHVVPFREILNQSDLVVTTRSIRVAAELVRGDISEENGVFKLKELSDEDGLALLTALAPKAMKNPKDRTLGRELAQAVGSLPFALVLMSRYLAGESLTGQPRRIREALNKLQHTKARMNLKISGLPGRPEDVPLTLMAAIDMSVEELSEETRQALYKLSVFRPKPYTFSDRDAEGAFEIEYQALNDLVDAGLLEYVAPPVNEQEQTAGGPVSLAAAEEEDEEEAWEAAPEVYRMPRTVAEYGLANLARKEAQEYHQKAVDYFASLLRSYEEERSGDATSYERAYSYEQYTWQVMKAAWLYHLAQTSDRTEANLSMAQIYFDVFWWWRCYNPDFPFCDQLLSEWNETQTGNEDQHWVELLTRFKDAYPTGYEKQSHGDWQTVEQSLLEIRRLGGLDGDLQGLEQDRQRLHLRAITNFFLAESYRYRSLSDSKADEFYGESLAIFEKHLYPEDDDWNLPWAYWHLADLAMDRGQGEKALMLVEQSLRQVRDACEDLFDECDNEIIGNDYRVRADVFWKQGDVEQAFRNYTLAVFYAYIFQALPKQADFYTVDFYVEMVTRTCRRLCELWAQGQTEIALQAAASLRQYWQPYWELEGGACTELDLQMQLESCDFSDLARLIFPRSPTISDLEDEGMDYVNQVLEVARAMRARIEEIS